AAEHRLGPDVDHHAGDGTAAQLAAGPVGALDHHDVVPRVVEVASSRQPGHTRADDQYLHADSVPVQPSSLATASWRCSGSSCRIRTACRVTWSNCARLIVP